MKISKDGNFWQNSDEEDAFYFLETFFCLSNLKLSFSPIKSLNIWYFLFHNYFQINRKYFSYDSNQFKSKDSWSRLFLIKNRRKSFYKNYYKKLTKSKLSSPERIEDFTFILFFFLWIRWIEWFGLEFKWLFEAYKIGFIWYQFSLRSH